MSVLPCFFLRVARLLSIILLPEGRENRDPRAPRDHCCFLPLEESLVLYFSGVFGEVLREEETKIEIKEAARYRPLPFFFGLAPCAKILCADHKRRSFFRRQRFGPAPRFQRKRFFPQEGTENPHTKMAAATPAFPVRELPELRVTGTHIEDALRCVIHTIVFLRSLGPLEARTSSVDFSQQTPASQKRSSAIGDDPPTGGLGVTTTTAAGLMPGQLSEMLRQTADVVEFATGSDAGVLADLDRQAHTLAQAWKDAKFRPEKREVVVSFFDTGDTRRAKESVGRCWEQWRIPVRVLPSSGMFGFSPKKNVTCCLFLLVD
jgi:Autophagy-related protein 101